MKSNELLNKDDAQLQELVNANREKLRELRFKDSNKQLNNIREIRTVKILIARIFTILNKKK